MKVREKVVLQDDNTFTIQSGSETLKFKLHLDKRSVELVSAKETVTPLEKDLLEKDLLRAMTSPKTMLDEELLKNITKPTFVIFSDVIHHEEGLKASLLPLRKLSTNIAKHRGRKPVVVIRVADKGGKGAGVNIDDCMRIISDKKYALDAHIVRIPDIKKKI